MERLSGHIDVWPDILGPIIGAGGLGAWVRERRKGRKDANQFALDLIDSQAKRIDALMVEVGRLHAQVQQLISENESLRVEVRELRDA